MSGSRRRFATRLQERWYGGRRPPLALRPLAALFAAVSAVRRRLLRPVRLPVRIVVVGNLAVGGSGKTPLVAWLASALRARGLRVGIVTRGYGGTERGPLRVQPGTPAARVGDEARWLAESTGVPVAMGADRIAAVRLLLDAAPLDLVLSDDGLQHYRLGRDVEIIAIDARRGLGNRARLPAGPLRESPARLRQADAVVLKGDGDVPVPDGVPFVRMHYRLGEAERLADGMRRALAEFRGTPVRALAAISDPESFFRALEAEGLEVERIPLPDHAPVAATVARLGAGRPLLVTTKDAVKLETRPPHVWQVPLAVAFSPEDARTLLARVSGDAKME